MEQHAIIGKSAHDARLAAALLAHGIPAILTFNVRDFARYGVFSVLDPAVVSTP